MSKATLDKFFGTTPPKQQERCSNPTCRKVITDKDIRFSLTIKGEEKTFCRDCYKAKLRPQEDNEESL